MSLEFIIETPEIYQFTGCLTKGMNHEEAPTPLWGPLSSAERTGHWQHRDPIPLESTAFQTKLKQNLEQFTMSCQTNKEQGEKAIEFRLETEIKLQRLNNCHRNIVFFLKEAIET